MKTLSFYSSNVHSLPQLLTKPPSPLSAEIQTRLTRLALFLTATIFAIGCKSPISSRVPRINTEKRRAPPTRSNHRKRLEGLTEAELETLLEQVEEEKRRQASGEQLCSSTSC